MGDTTNEKLTDQTHSADRADAQAAHDADRPPTDEEAERAESLDLDPEVKKNYEEANERGANTKGEGRIS